mgnify:FL=1
MLGVDEDEPENPKEGEPGMRLAILFSVLSIRLRFYIAVCLMVSGGIQASELHWSPDAEAAFLKGGQVYANGSTRDALDAWMICLQEGESAAIHHNLGVAHYRMGATGRALWHLERADRMGFMHPDTQNALRYLRQINGIEELKLGLLEQLALLLPEDVWSWIAVGSFWLSVFCWSAYAGLLRRRARYRDVGILTLLTVIVCVTAWVGIVQDSHRGVVWAGDADLKVSPTTQSESLITLQDGSYARLLRTLNQHVYVEAADGTRGWLKDESFRTFRAAL